MNVLGGLMRFFWPEKTEPQAYPVARCLEIIADAGVDGVREALLKLYSATNFLRSELGLSPEATFAELKASLRPDQAGKVAERTRDKGYEVDVISEMGLMLVSASLHFRAGAAWIDAEQAALIDLLISTAEEIAEENHRDVLLGEHGRHE